MKVTLIATGAEHIACSTPVAIYCGVTEIVQFRQHGGKVCLPADAVAAVEGEETVAADRC